MGVAADAGSGRGDFEAFVSARAGALRRTAYLLCGNWHQAEDIVQIALTKLYLAWRRIEKRDGLDAYARQIVVRSVLDERRRWRRESPGMYLAGNLAIAWQAAAA